MTVGTSKNLAVIDKTALVATDSIAMVDALISQWVKECDVAENTAKSYKAAVKCLVNYLRSNNLILSENVLIDYREFLKREKETSTAKLFFGRAKKFVSWLAKRGYVENNYADGLKGVKLDTSVHSKDALSLEEAAQVINLFAKAKTEKALRDKAILTLLICCGLRSVEVIRLDVGDIEKRRGVWTARIWGKGRAGKNDTVIIPFEVKTVIDDYLAFRGKVKTSEPLFTSTSRRNLGERIGTQNISRLAKNAFKNIGIDSRRITCHSLRHSNATIALDFGVALDSVSKNLRHKAISTTEIYRHDEKIFSNTTTRTVATAIFQCLKGVSNNG